MKITIKRFAFKPTYTIGKLYISGKYFCDTLEPYSAKIADKDKPSKIKDMKTSFGVIAIPTGSYRVVREMSKTFKRKMPYLCDVPCFEGVMIHPGNYPKDTRGCILPGWNRRKGMVCGSITAFSEISKRLDEAFLRGDNVSVEIRE